MRLKRSGLTLLLAASLVACGGEDTASTTGEGEGTAMATLTGTVSYRERIALPINASINVRLLDVSLMDVPARVLAEDNISAQGQSVPIPYMLEYDPKLIRDGMSYAVRAEIRDSSGALMWTTDTVHPVLTRDAPADDVEIRVVRIPDRD